MQNWQLELTKKCSALNMEAVASLTGLTIICPKMPDRKNKSQLITLIPEDVRSHVNFEEGPKPSTLSYFKNVIIGMNVAQSMNVIPDMAKRHIKITIQGNGNPEIERADWSRISDLFEKDGYFESWEVDIDGNTVMTYNRTIVKELCKNQFRDRVIQKDEITDLHILLNTEMDFDKLLEKL